jgi:transposase
MTRSRRWKDNGRKGKEPAFQAQCNGFPVLYKDNMFLWSGNGKAKVKLFNGKEWLWYPLPFEPIILDKRFPSEEGWKQQNPMLVKKNKRWSLHFPFEKSIHLPEKDFLRPVLAVDLGLNTMAVCSVVDSDGTVTHREFISALWWRKRPSERHPGTYRSKVSPNLNHPRRRTLLRQGLESR